MSLFRLLIASEEETVETGFRLGVLLKSQGASRTVLLYGDLGSGKTTFVKGFAEAFGIQQRDVASASFVIVAEYASSPPLYHIDLYRLERSEEVDALGIWEYMDNTGMALIEWADRLTELPENPVSVTMIIRDERSREIIIGGLNGELPLAKKNSDQGEIK